MEAYAIQHGDGKVWTAYTDDSGTEQVIMESPCVCGYGEHTINNYCGVTTKFPSINVNVVVGRQCWLGLVIGRVDIYVIHVYVLQCELGLVCLNDQTKPIAVRAKH